MSLTIPLYHCLTVLVLLWTTKTINRYFYSTVFFWHLFSFQSVGYRSMSSLFTVSLSLSYYFSLLVFCNILQHCFRFNSSIDIAAISFYLYIFIISHIYLFILILPLSTILYDRPPTVNNTIFASCPSPCTCVECHSNEPLSASYLPIWKLVSHKSPIVPPPSSFLYLRIV